MPRKQSKIKLTEADAETKNTVDSRPLIRRRKCPPPNQSETCMFAQTDSQKAASILLDSAGAF